MITTRNSGIPSGQPSYKKYFGDDIALSFTARNGLKPEAVFDFIRVSGLHSSQVEYLLNKTIKTFNSYKTHNTSLDPTTSEKLLKLFALYDKGSLIFGSAEEFNTWLALPSIGMGDQAPETLLNTITGIDLVIQELVRIEYGDLA